MGYEVRGERRMGETGWERLSSNYEREGKARKQNTVSNLCFQGTFRRAGDGHQVDKISS